MEAHQKKVLRLGIPLAAAGASAVAVVAASSAGPPPPILVHVAVSHIRPVAGRTFTGVAVANAGPKIDFVGCRARIGGQHLRGRLRRFYANGIPGPATVTCSWQIPKRSRGKQLLSGAVVFVLAADGIHEDEVGTGPAAWRIR